MHVGHLTNVSEVITPFWGDYACKIIEVRERIFIYTKGLIYAA